MPPDLRLQIPLEINDAHDILSALARTRAKGRRIEAVEVPTSRARNSFPPDVWRLGGVPLRANPELPPLAFELQLSRVSYITPAELRRFYFRDAALTRRDSSEREQVAFTWAE